MVGLLTSYSRPNNYSPTLSTSLIIMVFFDIVHHIFYSSLLKGIRNVQKYSQKYTVCEIG